MCHPNAATRLESACWTWTSCGAGALMARGKVFFRIYGTHMGLYLVFTLRTVGGRGGIPPWQL